MPSPGMRGWYVELDEKLVEKFERLFPEHGMKAVLTSRAVVMAVMDKRIPSPWGPQDEIVSTVTQPQEGPNVSRDTRRTEVTDGGAEATDDDVNGPKWKGGDTDPTPDTRGQS